MTAQAAHPVIAPPPYQWPAETEGAQIGRSGRSVGRRAKHRVELRRPVFIAETDIDEKVTPVDLRQRDGVAQIAETT